MSTLDIPGFSALQCVISSLRDTAHFTDEEGDLTDKLRDLRDWVVIRAAVQAAQPQAVLSDEERMLRGLEQAEPSTLKAEPVLTDEQIKRHSLLAADCPGASTVMLVSSLRRLLAAAPTTEATSSPSDAERYQLVRRGQHWSVIDGIGNVLRGDDLDTAVDAIRATKGGKL